MKRLLVFLMPVWASQATAQFSHAEVNVLKRVIANQVRKDFYTKLFRQAQNDRDSVNYLLDSAGDEKLLRVRDSIARKMDNYLGLSVIDSPYVKPPTKWRKK
jgi:hypothetical protein